MEYNMEDSQNIKQGASIWFSNSPSEILSKGKKSQFKKLNHWILLQNNLQLPRCGTT